MFIVPITREAQILRLFDDTLERFFGSARDTTDPQAPRRPALDVAESERSYTVKLDLPGVAKEDVKIAVEGRQVSVQAHASGAEVLREGERLVYRERGAPSYARSFTLPVEVDLSEAQAKLDHGVLTLTLPKRGARTAAHITVS